MNGHRGKGGPPKGLTPKERNQWYLDHMPKAWKEMRERRKPVNTRCCPHCGEAI